MTENIQRTFTTGDEWLYYKIYSGPKTADLILSEIIKPTTEKLLSGHIIDKWFFIRYSDPKQHLRLRFHYIKPENIFNIIREINTRTKLFIDQNLIWKVQLDSYQREIERYGTNNIELFESLFFHDSNMISKVIASISGDEGERFRWIFSLRAIHELLNDFNLNTQQKLDLMKNLADNFGKECGLNSHLIKQLSNKFRNENKVITEMLDCSKDNENNLQPLIELIQEKSEASKVTILKILNIAKKEELKIPLEDLLSSYIHMMMNRLFKSKQRVHEMVIYGFLFRHYKSMIAREKYSKPIATQTEHIKEIAV